MAANSFTKALTMIKFKEFQGLIGLTKENSDLDPDNDQISSFDDESNPYSETDQYTDHSSEDDE